MSKTPIVAIAGFSAGIAFVLACGTDGLIDAPRADAASTCDCPIETPIENRIKYVKVTEPLQAAETQKNVTAACDTGAQVIGGFCSNTSPGLALLYSGPNPNFTDKPGSFICIWDNRAGSSTGDFTAIAVCLNPAATADAGH